MSGFWDILICAIQAREDNLRKLIKNLARQQAPGVTVTVCLDNGAAGGGLTYPAKCRKLLEHSTSTFVSFIDDDDDVAPDYVEHVTASCARYWLMAGEWPDHVGFHVRYTVDGAEQLPVSHSLRFRGWNRIDDGPLVLTRDFTQLDPIKRELALLGRWTEPGWQADFRWANEVRATGRVRTEAFVDKQLYYKQDRSSGDFRAGHTAVMERPDRPFPAYPWLRWI